ncbi:Cholesterol oxidase [Camellia lanceoleosa]|uniref:Cholesterol oxidase n=1 Tax=Camellia lanceoleosa TaxID=1840588 RepID=A0ACC0GFK9_9ERIC|nr:Cholesterol oxidase [Camellia lanceoleosa]
MAKVDSEGWFNGGGDEEGYAVVVGSGYGGSVAACRMSMARIKVCLMEKGRRWQAHDFPTDVFKFMSAVRMENTNLGFTFGPKDALFQVSIRDDSVATVACGLGGGSLVNAGVMIPAPIRARRNPKWPKEWEKDWEMCEASASSMLRIQSVPIMYPNAKIMKGIVEEDGFKETSSDPLKLSVNFDIEEQPSNSSKFQEMGSCLACGNCLAGCPYNAKNSTDKNYSVSAVQAGCTIKTQCQVQYVVQNPDYICEKEDKVSRKNWRRWHIYLNEIDYVASDFVILSGGVFGTTEILFQSQMRGLNLSERLGSGFSCNGNTVAYLAGSPAPLGAYALDKKQFTKIPFQKRPGPSISSSYTSSLGFTIQSAVLPVAYPYLLFKGIFTYGWPSGYWFLHGIIDTLKLVLGMKYSNAMVFNAMGYDESDGKITFDKDTNRICFQPPLDHLLPRKLGVFQNLTKKLGGILFMSRYWSTSVHLLGGCNASSDPSQGVCNPNGQVFDTKSHKSVHPGLYTCDASLIPCSLGINPCLSIATVAEHLSRNLVSDVLKYKSDKGMVLVNNLGDPKPGSITSVKLDSDKKSMVVVKETMRGYVGGMPCVAYLKMKMNSRTWKESDIKSKLIGLSHPLLRGKVRGYVLFSVLESDKLHIVDGEVDLCEVDERTPYTQYMHYTLLLAASSGSRYILEGKKVMNPYLFGSSAWRETTTMNVTFNKVCMDSSKEDMLNLKGKLSISMIELLKCLISLEGNMRRRFVGVLLQNLFKTYILQVPRGSHKEFNSSELHQKPYQDSILHEIQTEDGFIISCKQWKGEKKLNPILLINGHSTENYWLPTEPNDLVRTLLEEGHETWLLQPRLHPLNPSNNFTIEDIGRFDIPAVINKIRDLHGPLIKIHVVAHCVGGLAIHVALMGGHVSAAHIASLSCTNSSMFSKLTTSSRVKMWLPLIPMSMVILGKDKILPLFKTSKASSRQKLLKYIARLVPRYERCTCDECEVFSGIFGNTFWHDNISPSMHYWLNKQSLPRLPMAGFPHLRKICNAGFIVDSSGKNSYLIHPERMALPTLYISGGRTLLVTPQTTFLATNYMKLHQSGFRHERVVVDGFGHSDLVIGEECYKKVFPHILSHIRLAEEAKNCLLDSEKRKYNKEALAWGGDPLQEGNRGFWSYISPLVATWLLFVLLLLAMVVYFFH